MKDAKSVLNLVAGGSASRKMRLAALASAVIVAATGAGIWFAFAPAHDHVAAEKPDSIFTSSYFKDSPRGYDRFSGVGARSMPLCKGSRQDNCVVDGETFWLNGQQIRISNIDAPALDGACADEIRRAREAASTLSDLLDGEQIEIRAQGRDRAGRLFAEILTPEGDIGSQLVRFRVAEPWHGRGEPDTDWCGKGG